ncbi:uncharacterized protein LOC117613607 isoform X2 [Prunus dulcis]|uniref:uncharacterized protein LOC117613607 isoform X2 n=1 Tax=Prunus dulcis TaxID=3755 RepID=UPI00148377E3|nr:uncharacterized protein LOC117613607 isoform X2 [Prunus dulcis]
MPATTSPLLSSFHSRLCLHLRSWVFFLVVSQILKTAEHRPDLLLHHHHQCLSESLWRRLPKSSSSPPSVTTRRCRRPHLLSSQVGFHSYDFSFSLSSGSHWLAFSQPLCGWLSLNLSVAGKNSNFLPLFLTVRFR